MKSLVYSITVAALGGFCLGVLVMYVYDVLMKRFPAKSASDTLVRGGPTELDRNRGAISEALLGTRQAAFC